MNKIRVIDFYNKLEQEFPEIKSMELLNSIDIENEGWENSYVMSKLAKQLGIFIKDKYLYNAKRILEMVEEGFIKGDKTLQSYLYTDFLVTISEQTNINREQIKIMFGPITKQNYSKILILYNENNK